METISEEETEGGTGGGSDEESTLSDEEEDEDPFSDRNRWKRGILEDPTSTVGKLALFPYPFLHKEVPLLPFLCDSKPSAAARPSARRARFGMGDPSAPAFGQKKSNRSTSAEAPRPSSARRPFISFLVRVKTKRARNFIRLRNHDRSESRRELK